MVYGNISKDPTMIRMLPLIPVLPVILVTPVTPVIPVITVITVIPVIPVITMITMITMPMDMYISICHAYRLINSSLQLCYCIMIFHSTNKVEVKNFIKLFAQYYAWFEINEDTLVERKLFVLHNCVISTLLRGC